MQKSIDGSPVFAKRFGKRAPYEEFEKYLLPCKFIRAFTQPVLNSSTQATFFLHTILTSFLLSVRLLTSQSNQLEIHHISVWNKNRQRQRFRIKKKLYWKLSSVSRRIEHELPLATKPFVIFPLNVNNTGMANKHYSCEHSTSHFRFAVNIGDRIFLPQN